ncbi:Transposon Ty3-I Gag-Pol polyprotein [Vitis vinifera]|uniref:Transposon Ty3-I Gag-Pol polyprotein n=1 Tax=Vitis vinifera TaxID=29760 RepID=A0A438ITB9_VITVI|nr:Transposon Ty3-I Gag-Pol polyprotein [Vitis vinifera]
MVSFLTNEGQTDLYGSQLAARQCYQIAREAVANQEDASPLNLALRTTNSNYWVRRTKIPRQNHDIFAWAHSDMKGIHPSIASHRLNVFSTTRPVRQRIRRFHPDRQRIIRNEIDKLLEAGFIREVSYPDWLANVVVVPKKEGKWRVCVDYTNLNNACPKDSFPLPRIDQIVDSTSGQGMLSFLDAFSGYHQIPMSPDDEEKNSIHNTARPLLLQSHSVEVYIDDIVVKSKTREQHILHLQQVFRLLRKYGMKLNPSKCAFGRYEKLEPQGWTDNCQNALERIKHCLMHPPILSSPIPKEKLYMYLAVSEWAISAALFRCPSPKEQKPVYYVSRALADVETRFNRCGMLQWAIELSEFGIEFQPRLSKKGQVMADFVLEYSRRPNQHHESSEQEWWTLRVDGASRSSGSGVGLLLQSPTGEQLEQAIRLGFSASNNEAEYEAILSELDLALALSVSKLRIYSDSQLVVRHVQKEYEAKDSRMARYLAKAARFHPYWGHLYKRSFTGPYLRCLGHSEARYVLAELHEGICGNHAGGRSLAHRAHSQGYYWPTMKKDAAAYVQKCDKCQRYAPIPHMPSAALKSVSGPWPFAQWGMDVVGPLPAAPAQKKFLLVATDYFSKWVEAEAYASIKDKDVTKFVWKNIVCRFGIPQAEATNKTLINALKKRLEQAKGKWVEELPGVLWAYRTTPGRPTGNTPFALTYGMDAVIPTEIGLPTIRTDAAKQKDANTELGRNLDWTDEVRESASIRMADYQQRASAHYNRKVRPRNFKNDAAASLPSVSFHSKLLSGVDSIHPLAGLPHPPPHEGGPQLILLDPLPQPTPPGGLHFSSRRVDRLASASSVLRRS